MLYRGNFDCFSNSVMQNSWSGKELKQFFPAESSDDLCILFCINSFSIGVNEGSFEKEILVKIFLAIFQGLDSRSERYFRAKSTQTFQDI